MTESPLSMFLASASFAALALAAAPAAWAQEDWPITEDLGFALYGQINQAWMGYDDGFESRGFFTVDNSTNYDGSYLGVRRGTLLDNGAVFAGRFVFDVEPRPSDRVSLQSPAGGGLEIDSEDIRYAEIAYATSGIGTFYFGQGDMSANLWATDYSGTQVIAGPNVSLIAGGMLLRFPDGTLSDRTLSDAIGTFDSGQRFRVRYDSPDLSGFTLSTSLGREVLTSGDDSTYFDLSAKYEHETTNWLYSVSASATGLGDNEYAGLISFAYLHKPSGLNLTFTGSHSTIYRHYFFLKSGLIRDWFSIGATALSFDWYNNGNWAVKGAEEQTYGLSVVQYVDAAHLQIYATLRNFDNYTNEDLQNEDFAMGETFAAGLLWTF